MQKISINHEPVELYKILKFECLVDGGGEAKNLIAAGYVAVNEELVTQKRKKIYSGDVIEFNGELYEIALAQNVELPQSHHTAATELTEPAETSVPIVKKKKRSAIKF